MDNLQLLMINVCLIGLLMICLPSFAIALYLCLRHPQNQTAQRLRIGCSLLLVALLTLWLSYSLIIRAQDINPICQGVGDPEVVACMRYGLVSQVTARRIVQNALREDLWQALGLPLLVGVPLMFSLLHLIPFLMAKVKAAWARPLR